MPKTATKKTSKAKPKLTFSGGEMGALISSFDWSPTPIGAPEGWSPALRTMVRVLLANRFPMLLWWGPEYVSIYNDAYSPILGRKHPAGLGLPVKECWAEIYDVLKPLIDAPFHGGPATWIEDIELQLNRAGFTEETHFTIAYSPVPDDTAKGGIGGVLATVHEITEKVIGNRRADILRDLGSHAAETKTAEAACAAAALTLGKHPKDIPFALLYLLDFDGEKARLTASCGIETTPHIAPRVIELAKSAGSGTWPLAAVRKTESMQVVENLASMFASVPAGTWPEPPHTAVVLPIRSNIAHHLSGFFVAGLSSHLSFDGLYTNFLDLARVQIATAVMNARAYEEERRRADALADIDRAKTAFFSNVSHEFRTPLTLMMGPLEDAIADESGMSSANRERLELAHRNSLRLLKLVNTLLDFSRIEAGRIQASYEPTQLGSFTAELASIFRSAVEQAKMRLVIDCPELSAPVYVDREMWEKIVLNLISNAFKFTFEGEVEVSLSQGPDVAELTVRDTGTGIPPDELPRLFDRFHRVKGARGRSYEGSGIGLALVQELVKLHGGTVRVESEVDRGSKFVVSVPFGTSHLPAGRIETGPGPASIALRRDTYVEEVLRWLPQVTNSPSAPNGATDPFANDAAVPASPIHRKHRRILLADDNADMRDYVRRLLERHGYEVEAVADGLACLNAARTCQPDLVLTDVMMPGLDGFALLRALRADAALSSLPVILLSARSGEEARVEGLQAGADDYLIKPFTARELLARTESGLKMAEFRREAAEAIRLRTAQFETLLNHAPLGVFLVDADFRIQQANPAALQDFGDIPGGVLGRDFEEVMHILWEREYAQEVVRIYRHTLESGESYVTHDQTAVRADRGRTEYYEWRVDRILLPDGRPGVVCYFRDIGDRKHSERTGGLLASIVDSSDDAIISKSLDAVITSWNQGAERLFGYGAAEAVGQSITMLIPPDRIDEEPKILERLKRGERIDHFETVRVRKDGSLVNLSLTISPVKDNAGRVVGASKVARDITERVKQEEAIKAANAALSHANADLKHFAYSASHDLQEPLRMIAIYSELLQERFSGDLGETGDEYIRHLVHGVQRMDSLLKSLRTYTQVSTTDQVPAEDVDANGILKDVLANLESAIEASGAEITSGMLPRVRIFGFQLEQVFQNLIGNAIHYRSGDPPRICIDVRRKAGAYRFSIQDNGIGISPEYKDQIFAIFKRLHSATEYEGTGMGLAICQRIIERAGGRIWVESEVGKGSTFFFTLPCPDC